MNTNQEDCENCLGSTVIFNGSDYIPCPDCTDKSLKGSDYQKKISVAVSNILKDEDSIESKEDSLT